MNAKSDDLCIEWIPAHGVQLRKAGVQFDAVRMDGEPGRALADRLARMTGGDPGPVIDVAGSRPCVYFLVAARSTAFHLWPAEVRRLTSGPDRESFVPVPALHDMTWPLSWRYPPTAPDRFVHTMLLRAALETRMLAAGAAGP
ncbi:MULTISPECIES: hypothetical protein [Streptomyces]|jgi:hypothetical protein|uniref:Uncharacterized protein n=1 Tax=Streptomyces doudnae TaxID=3075536 RepID=A0ABD5EXL6_9ACTN|nr:MULTISPECIES: hypothetical protein [unclassified Streptomyces]MDT0438978.1 hypothetical protein [Streptomyces sp. DSM 41981]MYQ63694.1 hypothetical protein [Streptomyces sp. SID4950]SCD63384.1 hypothetical protein GA0115242_11068 [Streptomyces sp. SolWspMP-5a-2]